MYFQEVGDLTVQVIENVLHKNIFKNISGKDGKRYFCMQGSVLHLQKCKYRCILVSWGVYVSVTVSTDPDNTTSRAQSD